MKFESNFIFLINLSSYTTKKSRQKFRYLEKEKSSSDEIKGIFHHFKRVFSDVNQIYFLEGESPTLIGNFEFGWIEFGKITTDSKNIISQSVADVVDWFELKKLFVYF